MSAARVWTVKTRLPKSGDKIQVKNDEDNNSQKVTVMGWGGKASSKSHPYYYNIRNYDNGTERVDLDKTD